ncbi:MAG: NusA-like transcription termination signal-binding factor [Nanoarchaeota archaeon]
MKFDIRIIGYITTFENFTGVHAKDCFFHDKELVFIVDSINLGRAVGKKGINIKRLIAKMKHKIRVIGFDNDPTKFVQNILYPLNGYEISREDNKIIIKTPDNKLKGKIYGRERTNLKFINETLKRHFNTIEVVIA